MMNVKTMTFNEFCHMNCDGLYDPLFSYDDQCTGYKKLKELKTKNLNPASREEIYRWENNPTDVELISIPDIKYLRFLHPLLRLHIIDNWEVIKLLDLM